MMYYYFVSGFILPNNGKGNSYFNAELIMPDKISSFEEVLVLRNKFALSQKVAPENVIILNYQLLRIE